MASRIRTTTENFLGGASREKLSEGLLTFRGTSVEIYKMQQEIT